LQCPTILSIQIIISIVFDFGNKPEKMQPGTRIVFGKLDFITDRFGDLRL
jgi:hypothetical protein